MTPPLRPRLHGFTLLELGLVLIVMGILAAAAMPLVTSAHRNHMREQDRQILETAKLAIIGYAYANKYLPECSPSLDPTKGCDHEEMFKKLGVRWRDSKNGGGNGIADINLYYYPGSDLDDVGGNICTTPSTSSVPETCLYTDLNPCAATSTQAFVLLAYGDDNQPNGYNTAAAIATPTTPFDSPHRPPHRVDGPDYYDDMIISMSLAELKGRICPPIYIPPPS